MSRSDLERIIRLWQKQKSRPFPLGILELIAGRLYYVGIALRQRSDQVSAEIGLAADPAVDFIGGNLRRSYFAYNRFAEEIKNLGGEIWPVDGERIQDGVTWKTFQARVIFHRMSYKKADRRSRDLYREARELERFQATGKYLGPWEAPLDTPLPEHQSPGKKKVPSFVTINKPRLVKRPS